ncbi:conserved hypothetical protein [Amphritea japonica ATCC BAA-1530]|uniref:Uncharacterized protein n=2 Tax=Amphritea TaxID=515417 RepID=A0A7R6P0K2_9GAMM|nr:conserved hypothetical protein [Amphritea japonica ATCC BAA-1530]
MTTPHTTRQLMENVIEKEIEESTTSIANQHSQCQWYVKTYLLSITGLFAIAAFFSGDQKLTAQAATIGTVYSFVVFFMGWGFLSVIAHKVSLIHMLYKHVAGMRTLRIKSHPKLDDVYALAKGKNQIKYGSLIKELPYLFFAFNFIFFAGGLSYFLAPHTDYHQTVSTVSAICIFFGTFYPIVCISFKKHIACAYKAQNMEHKNRLEEKWANTVSRRKKKYMMPRVIFLLISNTGASILALLSFYPQEVLSSSSIVILSYIGIALFASLRYSIERWRLKIGVKAIHSA